MTSCAEPVVASVPGRTERPVMPSKRTLGVNNHADSEAAAELVNKAVKVQRLQVAGGGWH
jgi:hypothetical protein